ncbi:MAG TPA: hypothetical protein DCX75_12280 [Brevundimonas sp.]|jgi:predicted metal-dependent enzyme (double-stranded beta helix superfamily)|nr:hypothetical protein [Brevundimonas sp.]HAJ03062.1 hypothetical protein [Brevundimonas sp.]HAV50830.1 hypothetical protein [Brevundimonas sp.]|tara:strand:+ start:1820 stop:2368 length:549 start_codon:yes stop_codon:yes gene_type:complete
MDRTALQSFTDDVRSRWGPLTSELAEACQAAMESLLRASPEEAWLARLHQEAPASAELHRDLDHGFMLLGHTEQAGLYRPPHDHGRSWVLYGIQRGEIEMRTYARSESDDGAVRLVRRNTTLVRAGQAQLYLPGDIHDTRCVSDTALLFRFTERDLRVEDREHHRLTRYVCRDGVWTTDALA